MPVPSGPTRRQSIHRRGSTRRSRSRAWKVKQTDEDLIQLQKWFDQLFRAEEREGAAKAAIKEVGRVSKAHARGKFAIPDADILKAQYENSTERIRNRILGRQNQEKAVRDKHKKHLDAVPEEPEGLVQTSEVRRATWRSCTGPTKSRAATMPSSSSRCRRVVTDRRPGVDRVFRGLRKMFGPAKVNSLIGTQWKGQIEEVAAHVRKAVPARISHPIYQMKLTLRIVPRET